MTTLSISVPDEVKAFIESQVAIEGHASTSEYLIALIREDERRRAKRDLEAKFREALDSGPAAPMTRDDWESLERKVWERHHLEQGQR